MKKKLRLLLGVVVSLLLVWLLFGKTDWGKVRTAIRGVDYGWLLLSQIFAFSSYFLRAKRWSYIVNAVHPVSYRTLFSATQIGFLSNYVIPARLGEAVRALVLTRLTGIPLSQSLVFMTLDRLSDVFVLTFFVLVTLFVTAGLEDITIPSGFWNNRDAISISENTVRTAAYSGLAVFLVILVILIVMYTQRKSILELTRKGTKKSPRHPLKKLRSLFSSITEGMSILSSISDVTKTIVFSLLVWAMHVLATAAILKGFHIDFPWYAPFVLITLTAFFISFPFTPGLIGQYHIAIILGLLMIAPQIASDQAKAVAIVAHILNMIPIAALGLICLYREHLKLTDVGGKRNGS